LFRRAVSLFADVQGFPAAAAVAGALAGHLLARAEAAAAAAAVAAAVHVTDVFRVCLHAASGSSAPPSSARAAAPSLLRRLGRGTPHAVFVHCGCRRCVGHIRRRPRGTLGRRASVGRFAVRRRQMVFRQHSRTSALMCLVLTRGLSAARRGPARASGF
jgi:hypothetical protein